MSRRSWTVYPGGWIRTSLRSATFEPVDPACEICRRASCGPYWFHLERRVVRVLSLPKRRRSLGGQGQ
jgi:hypothetical protein